MWTSEAIPHADGSDGIFSTLTTYDFCVHTRWDMEWERAVQTVRENESSSPELQRSLWERGALEKNKLAVVKDVKTFITVDSGLRGGLALWREGQPAYAVPMPPTEGDLVALLREIVVDPINTVAVVEEVGGCMGKAQPASSAFKFGRNFGFLLGVLQALGVRIELVRPQEWQKALGFGSASDCASKTEWKNILKACAQRLHPHLRPTLATANAHLILEHAVSNKGTS